MSPVPIFLLITILLHTGSVTPYLEEEKEALISFMKNLKHPTHSNYKYKWDESTSPCTWSGVECHSFNNDEKKKKKKRNNEFIWHLRLPAASLAGTILPDTIGKITTLRTLTLHSNGLYGEIPSDLSKLKFLRHLVLYNNSLTGDLLNVKLSPNLYYLDVSYNKLNGTIPSDFSKLTSLRRLFLNNNSFSGKLPDINAPNLNLFNVSNNRLNISISKSLYNFTKSAFSGNVYVCGGRYYEPCKDNGSSQSSSSNTTDDQNKDKNKRSVIVGVSVTLALFLVILLCCLRNRVCRQMKQQRASSEANLAEGERSNKLVVFDDRIRGFGFHDLLKASADFLGNGSVGTSYKQVIVGKTTAAAEEVVVVVVKRLKDVVVTEEEFEATMEVLGKMKNKYLVPLIGYYNYSEDEKWLLYDFMLAGSLSAYLHGGTCSGRTKLDWDHQMKIALNAAKGLAYLHQPGKVVHGNIKSSNILLGQETNNEAYVSDYGLNTLFGESNSQNNGYWAPEVLEARQVTSKSDVYSFGVLLLEILKGETPKQTSMGKRSKWVESIVCEEPKAEIFDVELKRDEMVHLLRIAKDCVMIDPDHRPTMHDVVSMMEDMSLRPSSDDHSKGNDDTPSTGTRDTWSTITP